MLERREERSEEDMEASRGDGRGRGEQMLEDPGKQEEELMNVVDLKRKESNHLIF